MNYWLVKSDADTYAWDDFVAKGKDMWEGVRNYQARNNLRAMKKGDLVLFYHSVLEKQVVGIAKVVKEHYPDPTAKDGDWSVVELKPVKKLKKPVTLQQVKADERLQNTALVRASRLSVMPLKQEEYDVFLELSQQK